EADAAGASEESSEPPAEETPPTEAEAAPEAQSGAASGEPNGQDAKFGSGWRLALRDRPAASEAERRNSAEVVIAVSCRRRKTSRRECDAGGSPTRDPVRN